MLNSPFSRAISGEAVSSPGAARVRFVALALGVALPVGGATDLRAELEKRPGVRVLSIDGKGVTSREYLRLVPEPVPAVPRVLGVDQGERRVVAVGLPLGQTDSSVVILPGGEREVEPGPFVRDGRVVILSHEERTVAPGVTVVLETERPLPVGVSASTYDWVTGRWTRTEKR